jgi:hypothetical protein
MIEIVRKHTARYQRESTNLLSCLSHRKSGHMNNWIKTCCTLTSPSVARLTHGPATVIVTIILLGSNALSQSDPERLGMSANELARKVVTNELKFQDEDHGRWMYRLEKEESGKKQVQEILETNNGSLVDSSLLTAVHSPRNNSRRRISACRPW